MDRRARRIACALRCEDVQSERVLMFGTTRLDFIAAFLGILYAGIFVLALNPPYPSKAYRLKAIVKEGKTKLANGYRYPAPLVSVIPEQESDLGHPRLITIEIWE
jgi:acyl-CoA synthetase (AMP-forming)/AMP-acid ligase II